MCVFGERIFPERILNARFEKKIWASFYEVGEVYYYFINKGNI